MKFNGKIMKVKNEDKTLLLILDLDETLIYATEEPLEWEADFRVGHYHVYQRPFLQEFIRGVREEYQLAVWSSATDDYVEDMVHHIFGEEPGLEFAWGRSRCTYRRNLQFEDFRDTEQDHHYLKPLKKVRRRGYVLERILVVDDTQQKLKRNYGNAIYVREYRGNPEDRELELLLEYLKQLKEAVNVRKVEKRGWWLQVGG